MGQVAEHVLQQLGSGGVEDSSLRRYSLEGEEGIEIFIAGIEDARMGEVEIVLCKEGRGEACDADFH